MKKSKVLLGFFIFISLVFLKTTIVYSAKDINCYCDDTRYELPGECLRNCKVSLKCPGGGCTIDPICPGLPQDKEFIIFYNQALFLKGRVPRPLSFCVLVAHIINNYYAPYSAREIEIVIGNPEDKNSWANISNQPNTAGKYILTVSQDLFWLSPAMIASSIGHEMIHLIQYKRKTSVNLLNINEAVFAFQELEASTWESGNTDFNWPIGPNKFFNCLLEGGPERNEKNAIRKTLKYREWQVRKKIEDLRELSSLHTGRGDYLKRLEQWLQENPWTNQVWLPANPDWKNYIAGPKAKE